MTGTGQGVRRVRSGRRAAVIGAVVAAVAVAAVVIGPVSGTLAAPRTMPTRKSGVPAGWAPVPYRDAQLSVPGSWLVEAPQQLSCAPSQPSGMIFAGVKPGFPKGYGCVVTANLAWIVPAGKIPKGITDRKPTAVIHGIPVYKLPAGKGTVLYLVPELGVRVGARGQAAKRVLATLTRSPLSVVLRRGPAAPVPGGWTWRQFGGVRFAVPRSWSPQNEDQWATCGTGLVPGSLLLVDATKPPLYLPCPYQIPTATAYQAQPGLTVVTGKYADQSVGQQYASCRTRNGVQICLSTVTGQGGFLSAVLILKVTPPHHAATFFLLGLSGTGATARAVFDSISPAQN